MTDRKYVIFDLDNCLSDDRARIPLIDWSQSVPYERYKAYHAACGEDPRDEHSYVELVAHASRGTLVIFMTARPLSVRPQTEAWISKHFGSVVGKSYILIMRNDGDNRPSVDVKRWMMFQLPHYDVDKDDVVAAYDDRDDIIQMYRRDFELNAIQLQIHDVCATTRPDSSRVGGVIFSAPRAASTEFVCVDGATFNRVTIGAGGGGKGAAMSSFSYGGGGGGGGTIDLDAHKRQMAAQAGLLSDAIEARKTIVFDVESQLIDNFNAGPAEWLPRNYDAFVKATVNADPVFAVRNCDEGIVYAWLQEQFGLPDPCMMAYGSIKRELEELDVDMASVEFFHGDFADRQQRAPDFMEKGAATFRERNAKYGNNYLSFGAVAAAVFPAGLTLETAEDFNRYALLGHCLDKLTRYANSLQKGGHKDSAHDLMVYAAMLEEITEEKP